MNKKLTQDIFKGKDKKWQWAAMDGESGTPTLYIHKPIKSHIYNFYLEDGGQFLDLLDETGYDAEYWEDSLIKRKAVNKIGLQKDIELLESGIGMNWSDMKKIETRLNREMSGMQNKLNELCLKVDGQQRQIHLAAESIGMNKQAIVRIEKVAEIKPQPKELDQSVFKGKDKKWRFAAVDELGTAYRYTKPVEPYLYAGLFRFSPFNIGKSEYEVIGEGYNTSDWQNSLIERESEELTGSDLTRALKKERDWVLAYVSNENDVTAEFHQRAVVVTDLTDNGDFICSGDRWRYAVAVNHNGKILSAKDVGII